MMFDLFVSIIVPMGFLIGLIIGLGLLLFPEKIMKWGEGKFTGYRQWYEQQFETSWMYRYFGIKIKSSKFFIWSFRIVGLGMVIICGGALALLISIIFSAICNSSPQQYCFRARTRPNPLRKINRVVDFLRKIPTASGVAYQPVPGYPPALQIAGAAFW